MAVTALARARLIEEYAPALRRIAAKVIGECGGGTDFEEVVGDAANGLVDAARRFDPARRVPFASFAEPRIRGAIVDGMRRAAPLSRTEHARRVAAGEPGVMFVGLDEKTFSLDGPSPEDLAERRQLVARLAHAVAALPARERELIARHYAGGENLAAIGRDFGLSRSWTWRLHERALARLAAALA